MLLRSLILSLLFMSADSFAQTPMDSATFDFWIGEWSATWSNADGSPGKGKNHIVKILDDKVIQENFEDESGFKGTSISVYNPSQKKWRQAWADNQGGYFDFEGELSDGKKIFKTKMHEANGKQYMSRMLFYDIKTDAFTWDWEKTEDGGKTWALQWRIQYARKK